MSNYLSLDFFMKLNKLTNIVKFEIKSFVLEYKILPINITKLNYIGSSGWFVTWDENLMGNLDFLVYLYVLSLFNLLIELFLEV